MLGCTLSFLCLFRNLLTITTLLSYFQTAHKLTRLLSFKLSLSGIIFCFLRKCVRLHYVGWTGPCLCPAKHHNFPPSKVTVRAGICSNAAKTGMSMENHLVPPRQQASGRAEAQNDITAVFQAPLWQQKAAHYRQGFYLGPVYH